MARSVRTRPDPGQLAFLIDLDVVPEHDAVPVPAPAPTPPVLVPDPASQTHRAEPADGIEPQWHAILDFERGWSGPLPAKQRAVRDRFAMSSARYHQLLDRALELPDAMTYDPALVARLHRIRETRRSKRFARRVDAASAGSRVHRAGGEEGPTGG